MFPFKPNPERPFEPLKVQDPFRLRDAVVPLFHQAKENLTGLGTAFLVDGCKKLFTAEHIIDVGAFEFRKGEISDEKINLERFFRHRRIIAVLGCGVVFGTVRMPKETLLTVTGMNAPLVERDDPLLAVKGMIAFQRQADFALLDTEPKVKTSRSFTLASSPVMPKVGEWVCAVGYPDIDLKVFSHDESIEVQIREESIQLAFGRVSEVHENGRGVQDKMPLVEVEANWRSGMSGGPVLNANGEVVGIVSRSFPADAGTSAGLGTATILIQEQHR